MAYMLPVPADSMMRKWQEHGYQLDIVDHNSYSKNILWRQDQVSKCGMPLGIIGTGNEYLR